MNRSDIVLPEGMGNRALWLAIPLVLYALALGRSGRAVTPSTSELPVDNADLPVNNPAQVTTPASLRWGMGVISRLFRRSRGRVGWAFLPALGFDGQECHVLQGFDGQECHILQGLDGQECPSYGRQYD